MADTVARPRRAASAGVAVATYAAIGEAAARKTKALKAVQEASDQAEYEEQLQRALEAEAAAQAAAPPHTKEQWMAHLEKSLDPAADYIWQRLFVPNGPDNGQRFKNAQFFKAASIFKPNFARGITLAASRDLLKDLQ